MQCSPFSFPLYFSVIIKNLFFSKQPLNPTPLTIVVFVTSTPDALRTKCNKGIYTGREDSEVVEDSGVDDAGRGPDLGPAPGTEGGDPPAGKFSVQRICIVGTEGDPPAGKFSLAFLHRCKCGSGSTMTFIGLRINYPLNTCK